MCVKSEPTRGDRPSSELLVAWSERLLRVDETVRDATISLVLSITDMDLRTVHQRWTVVDAVLTAVKVLAGPPDPSATEPHLTTTMEALARLYAGDIDVVELPDHGGVTGTWTELMLLAGLFDSAAWRDAFTDEDLRSGRHAGATTSARVGSVRTTGQTPPVDDTRVREVLERQIDLDGLGTGGHVVAHRGGEVVLDVMVGDDGTGRALRPDTLFSAYCALKPLLAIAIAQLVDEGEISFNDRLGDVLDGLPASLGALQVGDLLCHNAGLPNPSAVEASMVATRRRSEIVRALEPLPPRRDGTRAVYSDFSAWTLLGLAVEELTGQAYAEVVHHRILEPLGLVGQIVLGEGTFTPAGIDERLGLNIDARSARRFPLLMERTGRARRDANPAIGGYATVHGLASIAQATLDVRSGHDVGLNISPATMAMFTTVQRPRTWDPALGRKCSFGFGFQTELNDQGYGTRPSELAYGHTNITAASALLADPENDLAIGFLVNGIVEDAAIVTRRKAEIVDAVYDSLA